ncbi:MAG: hypothetical protein JNK63_11125 [Chthonomonas sp.]|nr:hypothetical protein [Chthonomonas sp.]
MNLNAYAADRKRALYDELQRGELPSFGSFDEALLCDAKAKGAPQMGSTVYAPNSITIEFIYSDAQGAIVVPISLEPPERIVFMPVPDWVIESIWQGDIDGSYHFESDASVQMAKFQGQLEPEANAQLFGVNKVVGKA